MTASFTAIRFNRDWITGSWVLNPVAGWQLREGVFPTFNGAHRCACEGCDPELRPPTEREDVRHFGLALGDDPKLRVYCGDHEFSDVLDVHVGPGGRALVLSSPGHSCGSMRHHPPGRGPLPCAYAVKSDEFSVRSE